MTSPVTDNYTSGAITTQNLTPTVAPTANSAILLSQVGGFSTATVQVTGTYTGALSAQASLDGVTWVTLGGNVFVNVNTGAVSASIPSGATGIWQFACAGYTQVMITALAAVTGTANVELNVAQGSSIVTTTGNGASGSSVVTQPTASLLNAQVVGNVASGATDSGNPVKIGGAFNTALPTLTNGQRGDLQLDAKGAVITRITGYVAAATDAIANASITYLNSSLFLTSVTPQAFAGFVYNGSTWDRVRGNVDTAALITLAAQSAGTVNSADQTNYNARGVNVVVDITAATAMTLTVNIQVKDVASGKYVTVLSSTALATTGTTLLTVYPGSAVAANADVSMPLSRTWRVQAVVTGTSVTATVGASVIL